MYKYFKPFLKPFLNVFYNCFDYRSFPILTRRGMFGKWTNREKLFYPNIAPGLYSENRNDHYSTFWCTVNSNDAICLYKDA